MARIEGEIIIGRPAGEVFDYVTDQRNEPQYNPRMVRAEKVTEGPVGQGTRFRAAIVSWGRPAGMLIELTGYDRPVRLAQATTMRQADISGTLTFEPAGGGTRMRWCWQVRPRAAAFRLLAPVIALMGRRQEQAIWAAMKQRLEEPRGETGTQGRDPRWRRGDGGADAVVNTSVVSSRGSGIAVIEAETDICRSAEEVFDYASDPVNEPEWNVRLKRIEKLTAGPVGVGARYRMEFTQGPPAVSECVRFERPGFWELAGGSKIISSGFGGRVVPKADGTHLLLRMRIRPRGPLRWALPVVRRRMQRELARDLGMLRARLEGAASASAGRTDRQDHDQ